jgi:hypothetical protein
MMGETVDAFGGLAMAYAEFDLKTVVHRFGLRQDVHTDLFANVDPIEPGNFLRTWLDELVAVALGVSSEKARSEFIIAPILVEMKRRSGGVVNVLPGVTLDVDPEQGLAGYCDYLIARSQQLYYVKAPILAVVEAKREDLIAGLGQCAAEMVAIRIYNEREGKPMSAVYGCVTSGNLWRFLRLEGKRLNIDRPEYYLSEVAKLLGILVSIVRGFPTD